MIRAACAYGGWSSQVRSKLVQAFPPGIEDHRVVVRVFGITADERDPAPHHVGVIYFLRAFEDHTDERLGRQRSTDTSWRSMTRWGMAEMSIEAERLVIALSVRRLR